jgi:hypothetical protein
MFGGRKEARRARRRAFQPTVDGRLESRYMLSSGTTQLAQSRFLLAHPQPQFAYRLNNPPFLSEHAPPFQRGFKAIPAVGSQTARGGHRVEVTATDGTHYMLTLSQFLPQPPIGTVAPQTPPTLASNSPIQPLGTVRAYPMPGGMVGIIVSGSTASTELDIDPLPFPQRKGYAHSFAYGASVQSHVLNIGQITVTSGQIGRILGFHTADLSGPLVVGSTAPIDRIAFDALNPGAAISVGGDLNTLDILNNVNLTTTPGISVGRDLNLLNVGGNITLSNGASLLISRDSGLVLQPAKGSGTGSNILSLNVPTVGTTTTSSFPAEPPVSAFILGNLDVGPGSSVVIGRTLDAVFQVNGNVTGASRIAPITTTQPFGQVIVKGTVTP